MVIDTRENNQRTVGKYEKSLAKSVQVMRGAFPEETS